jgi:hypothetical protein
MNAANNGKNPNIFEDVYFTKNPFHITLMRVETL